MPELPEVETMRRGILGLIGRIVDDVHRTECPCKPISVKPRVDAIRRRLAGQRLVAVRRLGKRLLIDWDNEQTLVIEPRMTGLVLLTDPPDTGHLRFRIRFRGRPRAELLFWDRRGLGSVRLLSQRQFSQEIDGGRIGPDALQIQVNQLLDSLGRSHRPIKIALMDQRVVAGIGNLYASEILHVAAIHPETSCRHLSAIRWKRLHAAIRTVLTEAILYEGSTLSDGTYRNALNQSGRYQNHHRVYDRAGQSCPTCTQGTIRRIVQAQRATFFCPRCQKLKRKTSG
jgi:formamidopyrimidine-DNA glycosylase